MAGSVSEKHPDWLDRESEWKLMRDAARGQKKVKEEGTEYLPMPSAFKASGQRDDLYSAYQMRAQFPEILSPTVSGLSGTIHRTEAQITLPTAMEGLWESATPEGLPLEALHARIAMELLTTGRYGLLVGASSRGSEIPWIAGYTTESIINWSDKRDFYVLDESGNVRDGFAWKEEKKYRVLELVDGRYSVRIYEGENENAGETFQPTGRGSQILEEIPFVTIGALDISPAPETPPLIGVARAAVALYQLSADYRWQLFMTGQETPTFINCDAPETVGAGVSIELRNNDPAITPEFKYVGPSGKGIEAHERAMKTERENAAAAGARLFDADRKTAESGDALKIRYGSQTASLVTIANASAKGLEKALRYVATMMGINPDEVVVKPNLSFVNTRLTPQEIQALVKSWQDRAISYGTLYENLQRGDIASAERDAEAELELIDDEDEDREDAIQRGLLPSNTPNRDPSDPDNPTPPPEQT